MDFCKNPAESAPPRISTKHANIEKHRAAGNQAISASTGETVGNGNHANSVRQLPTVLKRSSPRRCKSASAKATAAPAYARAVYFSCENACPANINIGLSLADCGGQVHRRVRLSRPSGKPDAVRLRPGLYAPARKNAGAERLTTRLIYTSSRDLSPITPSGTRINIRVIFEERKAFPSRRRPDAHAMRRLRGRRFRQIPLPAAALPTASRYNRRPTFSSRKLTR